MSINTPENELLMVYGTTASFHRSRLLAVAAPRLTLRVFPSLRSCTAPFCDTRIVISPSWICAAMYNEYKDMAINFLIIIYIYILTSYEEDSKFV